MMKTLRSKIFLFVSLLLLLPALPLSIFIMQLLDQSYHIGVNERVETALDGGLEISASFYQLKKNRLQDLMDRVSNTINPSAADISLLLKNEFKGSQIKIIALNETNFMTATASVDIIKKYLKSYEKNIIWPSADRMTLYALSRINQDKLLELIYHFPQSFQQSATNIQEVSQIYKTLGMVNEDIRNSFLYFFLLIYGLGALVALFVSYFISKRITQPIGVLTKATEEIARGNLDYRIVRKEHDEFGVLALAFNHMIEELSNNQRRIIELEKMATWQQMARRLAHEIKNPLTPIQLMAQQIIDKYSGSDPDYKIMLVESCDIIEQEVNSLKKLVRAFSDFARLPDFQPALQDLKQLLLSIDKMYPQVRIRMDIPTTEAEAVFDFDSLKRVLVNLVENALSAGGEEGPVYISLITQQDSFRILIKDEGSGIAVEHLDKIFEPYFSTKQTGVGLGLSIVKKIVDQHGGSIHVQSKIDKGTTITIYLPKGKEKLILAGHT
jgi:nitrogen fixation/metabolism regulation signal transduction histidine kinase